MSTKQRKNIVVIRLTEEVHKELKIICIHRLTSIQKLLESYVNLVLLESKKD